MIDLIGNDTLMSRKVEDEHYDRGYLIWIGTTEETGFYLEQNQLDDAIEILQKAKEIFSERERFPFEKCTDKWISKNGEELDIRCMETKHIINSIALVDRTCGAEGLTPTNYSIYNKLKKELGTR